MMTITHAPKLALLPGSAPLSPSRDGNTELAAIILKDKTSWVTSGNLLQMVACGASNFVVYSEMCYCPQVTFLPDVSSHPLLFVASTRVDTATADFQSRFYRVWLEAGGVHRFFSRVFCEGARCWGLWTCHPFRGGSKLIDNPRD